VPQVSNPAASLDAAARRLAFRFHQITYTGSSRGLCRGRFRPRKVGGHRPRYSINIAPFT
jgi:hypothetical protein